MANPVIVQTAPQWGDNAASLRTLTISPFNQGDLLVLAYYANGGPATAVSGGGASGAWTCATSYYDTSGGTVYTSIWWAVVATPGTAVVTVTDAAIGTNFGTMWCREFTAAGANWQAGPVSKPPGTTGSGSAPSGGTGTAISYPSLTPPAGGNALYVGAAVSYFSNMQLGPDTGFYYTAPKAGGSGQNKQVAYIPSVSTATSTSATSVGSGPWVSVAAMFTAGGGFTTAAAWASSASVLGGGSGSWSNPSNAVGPPSGSYATWSSP